MNPKVRVAIAFLDNNLHRDVYVTEIAQLVRLSRSRFSHLFKIETGITLIQYLKRARMEKARRILQTSSEPVKAVAADVGYMTQLTLSVNSKRLTAQLPCNIELRILLGFKNKAAKENRTI